MREQTSAMLRQFVHLRSDEGAHRVAVRAGISVAVPLLAVLLLGHPDWSLYAAFGAFTSLYGRNHVHLSRAAMQASAAAALTGSVVLGALVASLDSWGWVAVVGGAVVAGLGTVLSSVEDWHPPGPLFLVFAFGAVASVPRDLHDVALAAAVTASSAAFAVVVGNVGAFVRRQRTRPVRLAPAWTWQPVRMAAGVLVAGGVASAVAVGHPYWAMVAAVAPLTARGITGQLVRAGHRVAGTLLGLLTAAPLLALGLAPVPAVLVVGVLQIATELLVGRNYGLALLFITPMALLMGQIAAPQPIGGLLLDRGVQTLIGAAVAVVVILVGEQARRRRGRRAV